MAQVTTVQQEIDSIHGDVNALRRRLRALEDLEVESKLRQADAEFTRLRGVEDQTSSFVAEAGSRLAALETAVVALQAALVAANARISYLEIARRGFGK